MKLQVALHDANGDELPLDVGYSRATGEFVLREDGFWTNVDKIAFADATGPWPPIVFASLLDESGKMVSSGALKAIVMAGAVNGYVVEAVFQPGSLEAKINGRG